MSPDQFSPHRRRAAAPPPDPDLEVSVVIPIFNEEDNIPELYRRLCKALTKAVGSFEIVFVNDCGTDNSLALLREIAAKDERVRIVSFARNFGHQVAISAGMRYARGQAVILMDGDLQDPPEVLPRLIRKRASEDWDVVYAIRRKRKEGIIKRAMYFSFYRILSVFSTVEIPLDTGDFCIMSRRIVDELNALPETNRFVRGLRAWVGFRQTGMAYERAARHAGDPKYTFRKLVRLAIDGLLSFSHKPLRISAYMGVTAAFCGILYALYVIVMRMMGSFVTIPGWATVIVIVLVMGGIQMMMLGVIGEYLGRVYDETKGRPQFVVEELIGFQRGGEGPRGGK